MSQTITPLNTVNCNSGTTAVNYYYRAFNLSADFGISDEFNVSSAEFGVETFSGTALNAVINIYSTSGTFPAGFPGNATLQGTATYSVTTADIGNIISVPVSAAIPAGEKMIYELISEDGQASGQALFFGSNNLGETDASYIAAPLCGLSAPTPMASIGFPNVHMVMNVVGEEAEEEDGCLNNTPYGSGTAPSTGCASVTFSTCNFAGEYITMSGAVAGTSYTFMSSVSTDYYTVREGSYDGPVIAFGQQPLTATATASGNLYIHINTDADCGTQNSCRVTSVVCASCPGPADYCAVTSTNTTYGINNFVTTGGVDNINNSGTGPGQYTDFTSMFVSQEAGESVSFTIDPVSGTHGFGIWVDWGDNTCFYDSGDHVYNSGAYISQATGTITVPAGTPAGDYRMRVVGNWLSQNPTPCGNLGSASYGEAEDYTFRVVSEEEDGCLNNTPYGSGTAPSTGCASVTFSTCNFAGEYITMSGAVAGTSYTFMSSVSTDYYTVREGSYDGPVIAFGQQPLTATATASGNLYIHINTDADCGTQNSCRVTSVVCASCPGPADYCAVTSTNTTYGINNFVTTGGVDNINNSGTGPGQYTDFTSMFVSQEAGESVSFTIDPVSGTHGFGIWVDWGDNTCFYDSGDHVYNSGAYISQATGTITVPAGTPAGDYRMRVVGNWLSQNPTPCGNLGSASYGEAEDYTFRVLGDGGGTGDPCDITFPHSNAN
ncbi:MAG: hypothetical protein H3C36_13510, partial [Chitinophagaceae bacterium]|nr:hypothetical protein [Chitinophagaceae bacterium]